MVDDLSPSPAELPEKMAELSTSDDLSASVATIRPSDKGKENMAPPPPDKELAPGTASPAMKPLPRTPSHDASGSDSGHGDTLQVEGDKRRDGNASETDDESRNEIQTIMDQSISSGPDGQEVTLPRLEMATFFSGPQVAQPQPGSTNANSMEHDNPPPPPPKPVPSSPILLHKPPLPQPDPEPDLPFDFHRFLEQLRHRSADPVARYLRSFLSEFGKRQWSVAEQVKIVADFLTFITNKMGQCEVWRDLSAAEFQNACEGMEKLVLNRIYSQVFSPAIPPPVHVRGSRRRRETASGRRGQHQEDVERDAILEQKIRIYSWVGEEHLDIKPVGEKGKKFLELAQSELAKINSFRSPRDKTICILNCCKVIFGLLRNSPQSDLSADAFIPLLLLVILHGKVSDLISNIQFILRFRSPEALGGEAGYYINSLMGAVQFIETMSRESLTISDEEFEVKVEAAVAAIAEKHEQESAPTPEKSLRPQSDRAVNSGEGSSSVDKSDEAFDEKTPVAGLLRTIQRPLNSIGRIFLDEDRSPSRADATAQLFNDPNEMSQAVDEAQKKERSRLSAQDSAARQASAEAAEAHRIQTAEHANVVAILSGMFPDLDKDVISDVVRSKDGRVHLAVDACLALGS